MLNRIKLKFKYAKRRVFTTKLNSLRCNAPLLLSLEHSAAKL